MALRFCDSADHYVAGDVLSKWSATATNIPGISAGRFGNCITQSNAGLIKTLDAQATWTFGAAVLFSRVDTAVLFMALQDSTTLQGELRLTTSGTIQYTVNAAVRATGTAVLSAGVWYYIELKVTIANAGGTADVHVNGVSDISYSGDTQNTANATADQIRINSNTSSVTTSFDDIYACDGTGGAPTNTFLGDVRVEALFPNGNGNSSQFVGSDADSTNNYLLVDETAPNGDTDYVESSTVNNKDTYAFSNLTPGSGTVYGLQVLPYARKTDAGTRSIKSVARLSGTEVDSSDKTLSTSYVYLPDIRETKPGGGSWSVSDVNSAEFGVKVSA